MARNSALTLDLVTKFFFLLFKVSAPPQERIYPEAGLFVYNTPWIVCISLQIYTKWLINSDLVFTGENLAIIIKGNEIEANYRETNLYK